MLQYSLYYENVKKIKEIQRNQLARKMFIVNTIIIFKKIYNKFFLQKNPL